MPEIYCDVDAALSEVPVNIAALVDDTDFKTREESVVYNQAGLDLVWNFVTTAGAYTQTAVTPTTAGVYDWTNEGNGMYAIEIPASAGGSINNDTEGFGWFSGFATGILPWRGPVMGFRAAGINNKMIDDAYSATRGLTGTALPDAVADAAGGLAISDAGGLDMDAHVISARRGGYEGGAVWIDTSLANTNTVSYVDGTVDNPVSTIAAATTIAVALDIKKFHLAPGSSITLAQNYDDYTFEACHATIALGGQSINNAVFNGATITGNDDGTNANHAQYFDCVIGTNTLGQFVLTRCYFMATLTLAEAGTYYMHQCFSGVAGTGAPTLDFGAALNASNVNMRDYSGGIEIENMGAGTGSYNLSLEGNGQLIINANCSATSTVAIRGNFTVTDNAGGAVTLSDDARYDTVQINGEVADALVAMFTSSAQLVDDVWDEILTGATHNIATSAGRRLRGIQDFQGYEGGAIWIDTVNGAAGTTDYENGTVENPVSTLADANTLATSLGFNIFELTPGSSITFVGAQQNQIFRGENWTLALGGQNIVGTTIIGATVSGIAAGVGTSQKFWYCEMDAVTHIKNTHFHECGIEGTQTVGEAGDYFFDRCHSDIAGTSTWIFGFGAAIGNTNLNWRNGSGGIQLENMGDTGTDTASIEGRGQIIEGTCTGGTVVIRGAFSISGETNITFTETARMEINNIAVAAVDTWETQSQADPTGFQVNVLEIGGTAQTANDNGADINAILADTNELQTDWTNGGRLDVILDIIAADTTTDIPALIAALNDLSAANVNAEMVDVMATDIQTLPGQAAPPNAPTYQEIWTFLYKAWRNKKVTDSGGIELYNDAGTVVDSKLVHSDDGSDYVKGEVIVGP